MKNTRVWIILAFAAALSMAAGCAGPEGDSNVDSTDDLSAGADEARSRTASFETFVGRDGQTYFYMLAGNGEKLLRSEGYSSHDAALDGIAALRRVGTATANYQLRPAVNGEWYFNVRSTNGAVLATSETYVTRYNATRARNSIANLINVANSINAANTTARFQIFRGENGQYYARLRAANGEIVLTSEGYVSSTGATNVVESLRRNATVSASYEIRTSANGQYYFVVIAPNNETIGTSETYTTRSNATRAVDTVVALLRANPTLQLQR